MAKPHDKRLLLLGVYHALHTSVELKKRKARNGDIKRLREELVRLKKENKMNIGIENLLERVPAGIPENKIPAWRYFVYVSKMIKKMGFKLVQVEYRRLQILGVLLREMKPYENMEWIGKYLREKKPIKEKEVAKLISNIWHAVVFERSNVMIRKAQQMNLDAIIMGMSHVQYHAQKNVTELFIDSKVGDKHEPFQKLHQKYAYLIPKMLAAYKKTAAYRNLKKRYPAYDKQR